MTRADSWCCCLGWAMSWCVLHTGGRCPGVFSTRVGDALVCSPHRWRCLGVFSTRVGDVLVCSPHGWAMSWCVLHTGGRCPDVFTTRVGDVQGDCTRQSLTSALFAGHLASLQWSRLDTGLPNDRTPFSH